MVVTNKYNAVKEQIENMIMEGEFPVGEQLPSEPELTQMFNVSRGTVRRALDDLEQDAIISRRSGAGTFVIRKPTKEPRVVSLRKQIEDAGITPSTKVLAKEQIIANQAEARVLEAFLLDEEKAAKTPVYYIDRLRYGNNKPLARQTIYLLAGQFRPDLLEVEDFTKSVFNIYARYHRQVAWADEIIQARPATPDEIELLEMDNLPKEQQFVYERNRISYDQENVALEVMCSIDRSDFFQAYRYRIVEDEHYFRGGKS